MEELQPGQVIIPNQEEPGATPPPSAEPIVPSTPITPVAPSQPVVEHIAPIEAPEQLPQPIPEQASEVAAVEPAPASWQFNQEDMTPESSGEQAIPEDIHWTAAEFIAHEKTATWYLALATVGLVAAGVLYFITKDKITTGITLFAAVAFGAFAGRKPKTQNYAVTSQGVQIGTRIYGFQDFKNFSVVEEGAVVSIAFMPLKRFMPALTIYVAPDAESGVVDFLSAFLPYQEHKPDAIDSLLRRIRF